MEKSPQAIYDELLVLQSQDGEEAAFAELVARWQTRLLRHAHRLTGGDEAAADIVQDSWLCMVRGLRRLDDPARFSSWAYRIVGNKCADWIRLQQRKRKLENRVRHEATAPESLDRELPGGPLEAAAGADDLARLRGTMRRMPREQCAILSMCYLDEMSVREIADILRIPRGTVKSRLYYAREKLKRIWKGETDE